MGSIWGELKRRSVVRVSIAYVVVAWLILQVSDVILNNIDAPSWVFQAILLLLAIGFPPALIISWAFEITPEGIRKDQDVHRSEFTSLHTNRKIDFLIIGVLSVAVVFFAMDKFVWSDSPAESFADDEKRTIAVMPFVNMSADPNQEYMSDGLAEEILNLLVRIPELRVTSRASAFSFKGRNYRTEDVGNELDVEHLLVGSVRLSDERIRISAQLVEVATDAQIWSRTWERNQEDIFAIQDEVARAVVANLELQLLDDIPVVDRTSPEAYSLYLQAAFFVNQRSTDSMGQAETLLLDVLNADPSYLPAQLLLAHTYLTGTMTGTWHPNEGVPMARKIAEDVIERDTDNAAALATLWQIASRIDYDPVSSRRYLDRALASDPNNPRVQGALAAQAANQGDRELAIQYMEEMRSSDPLGTGLHYFLARQYWMVNRLDEAESNYRRAIQLSPGSSGTHFYLGAVLLQKGEYDAALREMDLESRLGYQHTGRALVYQAMGDAIRSTEELDKLIALGDRWTYQIAAVHAYLNEPDEAFYWLDRAMDRRDTSLMLITNDPFMDNIRDDPRYPEVLEKLGIAD